MRVFLSRTNELASFPPGHSFIDAAKQGLLDDGCSIVEQDHFAADSRPPVKYCDSVIAECDAFVIVVGFRYGTPTPDHPERSHVEAEHDAAITAGLPIFVFLLRGDGCDLPERIAADPDPGYAARQLAFRQRLWATHLCKPFSTTEELRRLVSQATISQKSKTPTTVGGLTQQVTGTGNIVIGYARNATISPSK